MHIKAKKKNTTPSKNNFFSMFLFFRSRIKKKHPKIFEAEKKIFLYKEVTELSTEKNDTAPQLQKK